jgi:uncharacterized protein (TIGR03435 family)
MTSWVDIAGWTLVHFVWQGAAIALLLALVLRMLRSARPQARYATACAALAIMVATPVLTALIVSSGPRTRLLTGSVRMLRSPEGSLVGVAVTPSSTPAASGSAAPGVTEFALPRPLKTDSLFTAIVTLWLAGVLVLLSRLAAGCWRVRRLQIAARLEPPSRFQSIANQIAARLHLPGRFSVVDSVDVATPTVIGWLRPVVMLPVAALSGLSPRQVEAILAHELAHIRRHDFAINLLQTLAETVLFYHPAVWWVSSRIRTEREHCCDDVAVAVCGDATEYAAALTELASWTVAHQQLTMAATRGPLLTRVRRLLRLPEPAERASRRTTAAVALALMLLFAGGVVGVILKAQPLALENGPRFGPDQVNELVGFDLFPGPVQLPGDDPIGTRAWGVTVGNEVKKFTFIGFTARSVIRQAYDLAEMPIVGAPRWMDTDTFDVNAPADLTIVNGIADAEQLRGALQHMFERQLGLTAHHETRTFPAYAMVLANADGRLGESLTRSRIQCFAGGAEARPNSDAPLVGPTLRERHTTLRFCGIDNNLFGLTGARVTMAELAREFHRSHYPLAPDREIVDRTGLSGAYDFELRFGLLPIAAIGHANYRIGRLLEPFGIRSVFTALPEQLGLKLVDTTVTREVLVIDHINRPY